MFNENKIALNFAVLSDIHISGIWGMEAREKYFKDIIAWYKEITGGKVDAFLMNGDFTDAMASKPNVVCNEHGFSLDYEEAKAIQNANEFRIIRSCLATIDEDTEIVYTLGNHDGNVNRERFITEFSSKDEIGDNKNFERMYRTDLDLDAMREGVRHCLVCGYHVLCLNMFADYTWPLEYLKNALDELTKAEPNKYVFVMFHCKTPNTIMFSNGWGNCSELGELLKNYPQVVLITGHTHLPLQNERGIWQGEYTAIEASTMDCIHNSRFKEINVLHQMHFTHVHGLLLQIDTEGNLRFKRLDLRTKSEIGEPWVLSHPSADGSHLKRYTNERAFSYPAPEFTPDATITLKADENGTYIEFPVAESEALIYRYEVLTTDKEGKSEVFHFSSLYCYDNPDSDIIKGVIPVAFKDLQRVSVIPQDEWFKCGKPINLYLY